MHVRRGSLAAHPRAGRPDPQPTAAGADEIRCLGAHLDPHQHTITPGRGRSQVSTGPPRPDTPAAAGRAPQLLGGWPDARPRPGSATAGVGSDQPARADLTGIAQNDLSGRAGWLSTV